MVMRARPATLMSVLEVDCAVLGISLAGIGAALELRRGNLTVGLIDHSDGVSIHERLYVQPTPVSPMTLTGSEFWQLARGALERAGVPVVEQFLDDPVESDRGHITLRDRMSDEAVTARSVVFAPNGSEPGLPRFLRAERLAGWGLSYCAFSDAMYFPAETVAVVGGGGRAFEQAIVAAKWASSTTILAERLASDVPPPLLRMAREAGSVRVVDGAQLLSLEEGSDKRLRRVLYRSHRSVVALPVSGLFVASELVPCWAMWDSPVGRELLLDGRVLGAGLANGVNAWDDLALFEDGVKVAREMVS